MFSRPSLWTYFKPSDRWWWSLRNLVDVVIEDREPLIPVEDGAAVTAMTKATERSIVERRRIDTAEVLAS